MKRRRRLKKRAIYVFAGALVALIAAAFAVRGVYTAMRERLAGDYRIIDEVELSQAVERNEYDSQQQKTLVDAALSLVGRVSYFWGGKSDKLGWDDAWGEPRRVTSTGHSTSGKTIPFGLDCSGYVSWAFIQLGHDSAWMIENIGAGTWNQWQLSEPIKKSELKIGDLAFMNEYPIAKSNHVGIVVAFTENGDPLISHCSGSENSVVVSTCGKTFVYFRRTGVLTNNGDQLLYKNAARVSPRQILASITKNIEVRQQNIGDRQQKTKSQQLCPSSVMEYFEFKTKAFGRLPSLVKTNF